MRSEAPILKRLIPSVKKKLAALRHPDGFIIRRANGIALLLNHRNYVDRQIAFYGDYERAQIDFLLAAMRKRGCDVFLDVGANFGLYAISVARGAACGRVIAFEPDPRNYSQLFGNLYLNRLHGDVEVHRLAVTDRSGTVAMDMFAETSTGQSRVSDVGSAVPIAAVSLDDFLSLEGKKVFVKIDVEGHELHVVEGMTGLLRDNDCFLQIESFDANKEKLEAMLAGCGFRRVHTIDNDHYFAKSD